jgi:dTDP-glucose 4,6-dehydratase
MQKREWIYVKDHINAISKVINNGIPGETSSNEISNVELVTKIGKILHRYNHATNLRIEHVQDRPGHDRRYP